MLDHIEGSEMTDTEKANWRSVGYFFRSYRYFSLLSSYGGVPWIDHVLSDDETELIKGPRASRDEIAKHILEDLQYAEKNINVNGEGKIPSTKHVYRPCCHVSVCLKVHGANIMV